jgi:hypothetical protein
MADLETSLRTLALQHPAVSAAFGTRFYVDKIPDGAAMYPFVRAQTITDNALDTHSSTEGGTSLVQLDVYDDDKAGCNAAARVLRDWLNRYHGGMGTYAVTIKIRNVIGSFDEEARLFRRILEASILYFG